MNGTYVKKHENVEKAIRRFKRICDDAGVLPEVKERRQYDKPSRVKRIKKKSAIRKAHRRDEDI